VNRTTNGTGFIRNMTKDQVRALKLNDGQYVPYLSGVLAMAKPSGVDVLIEMKAMGGRSTFRDLAEQVRGFGTSRIRVTSFSRSRLNKLHAIAPDIRELLITSHQVSAADVAPYGAVAINRSAATPEWLASMPSANLVFVYLLDTPDEWRPLAAEVTGIITNNPTGFESDRPTACPA
jgi:glycerophosphoryl diester phosphodiesterase